MTPTPRMSTQELGLILGAKLLKTDDLHYGFWNGGMEVTFANLGAAQEAYTEFLIGRIPAGVKSVLDVGCGTGALAKRLLERGYRVECVTPSDTLADLAVERLGPDGTLRFPQQYETGAGDYTRERHAWLDGLSIEDVANGVKADRQAEESESSAS